jgi:hypothetical protein
MIEHISLLQGKDEMLKNNYEKKYYWVAFSYNTRGQFSGICGRFLCSKLALNSQDLAHHVSHQFAITVR